MNMLPVDKSIPEIEAELARLRRKHSLGISRKLGQIKTLRTALLKAEVDGGKIRVRSHPRNKHAEPQGVFV